MHWPPVTWVVGALLAGSCFGAQAGQGTVVGPTLTSSAFPVGTITVDARLDYLGTMQFVLYDVAQCEIHIWVDAPDKRVKRLYWVQFESYLPDNTYTYDYSDLPVRTRLGGHDFFNGVRFFNLDQEKSKWRPGSDYAHVVRLLDEQGYALSSEVMELALFSVDGTARKELMILYWEDLGAQGITSAALMDNANASARTRQVAEGLRKRGLAGIRVNLQ